jgi:hypothetical protein
VDVAQGQSTGLWNRMLRVQIPSSTQVSDSGEIDTGLPAVLVSVDSPYAPGCTGFSGARLMELVQGAIY